VTDLDLRLRKGGIGPIEFGVESTARFTYEYGYSQVFARRCHDFAFVRSPCAFLPAIFRRMGKVRKTAEIMEALGQ
jgi:hypothetical protein